MSGKERRRLELFHQVKERKLSVSQAGRMLGLSERQARRIWKRYVEQGDAGLLHGLRGRAGNAGKAELRVEALALYREKYQGFGAAHAAELMGEEEIKVPRQTLWRWLKAEGLVAEGRRMGKHRVRRARRESVGELVQMDGSTHRWLGEGSPAWVLFVMIDDASSRVYARFYASEDTASAFDLVGRYVRRYGVPLALYVDQDSIYVVNDEQAKEACRQAGKKHPQTQFGRAMEELGVKIICAGSPQAKGRVERVNRTFQDRLVKELKLHGIADISSANAYLEGGFLDRLNALIQVQPAEAADLHRKLDRGIKLQEILCLHEERTVSLDWCVRYQNRILQIDKCHARAGLAGKRVDVLELADGTLKLKRQGRELSFRELAEAPPPLLPPKKRILADRTPWRPGPDHPWKQGPIVQAERGDGGQVKPAPLQSGSLRSPSLHSAGLTWPS